MVTDLEKERRAQLGEHQAPDTTAWAEAVKVIQAQGGVVLTREMVQGLRLARALRSFVDHWEEDSAHVADNLYDYVIEDLRPALEQAELAFGLAPPGPEGGCRVAQGR